MYKTKGEEYHVFMVNRKTGVETKLDSTMFLEETEVIKKQIELSTAKSVILLKKVK